MGCRHKPDHLQRLPILRRCLQTGCIIDENGTEIPKIKVSENVEKVTNPGNKKILRIYDKASGKIKADLITLEDEVFTEDQPLTLFDPLATWKRTRLEAGTYTIRELLVPIFKTVSVSMNLRLLWTFRLTAHRKGHSLG